VLSLTAAKGSRRGNVNRIFKVADVNRVEEKEKPDLTWKGGRFPTIYVLVAVTLSLLCIYAVFRGTSLFNPGYRWFDHVFAVLLLMAELFILFHGIGYLLATLKATKGYRVTKARIFVPLSEPHVAVIIASFNEAPAMLEDTIISVTNLDYGNKTIYLLDDSTKEDLRKGAEALAAEYGCIYVHRENRRGYKAGAINDLLRHIEQKYVVIFDADQKPVYNILREVIPLLEEDDQLALVQTPQFYSNTKYNAVASGAAHQQAVFYEYICEGKGVSGAMFCCGTNVVLRAEALRSVGGFDETSVTEDFATSVRLHIKGWKTLYYNHVFVYGLGPETLAGYFTQQMRWAMGTLGVFKRVVAQFLRHPKSLPVAHWWEYSLSGSYYFIGWVWFIFIISPVVFILFGVRPVVANPLLYLAAFVPYFGFSLYNFYFGMIKRGHRVRDLFKGQALGFISFWVLMQAAVAAMLGRKRAFGVTPKGAGGKLPWRYLAPQLLLLGLSAVAVIVGVYKSAVAVEPACLVNVFWALYHGILLSSVLYFNRAFAEHPDEHIFRDWATE
jgi:cellulose synthase (UDP-forming)